jgi:hypothetical protein
MKEATMSTHNEANITHYNVQVGHWKVQVPGRDSSDAIEQARLKLFADMPRLWDVISKLTADRFTVELVG